MELITFKLILVLALFLLALTIAAYSTWAERKVAAVMQDRIGPSKAGPFGLLQPLADGGKFFFKEDFTPANAERFLFILGPSLVMFISLITGAVIPWEKSEHWRNVFRSSGCQYRRRCSLHHWYGFNRSLWNYDRRLGF